MVGTRLRRSRDGAEYRVVGRDGSHWSIAPIDFGPALSVSVLELETQFDVIGEVAESRVVSEAEGWSNLAARNAASEIVGARRVRSERSTTPDALTPEQAFAAAELSAQEIVGSPLHLRSFFGQALAVSAETAAAIHTLIVAKTASEIAADPVLAWAFRDGRLELSATSSREVRSALEA